MITSRLQVPWIIMSVALGVILLMEFRAGGGNLEPENPPGSTMHTLEDIYNAINSTVGTGVCGPNEGPLQIIEGRSNGILKSDLFLKGQIEIHGFTFGVEREMKESGEKGGTEDINIGIGELQECTISKNIDAASAKLAQFAINGNSLGSVEIQLSHNPNIQPYYRILLDRAFIKDISHQVIYRGNGQYGHLEKLSIYYNRIAWSIYNVDSTLPPEIGSWDNVLDKKWEDGEALLR